MFTGLVQDVGKVVSVGKNGVEAKVRINSKLGPFSIGESIAVNGACLSVTGADRTSFDVFASSETLEIAGIGAMREGERVNLERALSASDPIGGHLVTEHVDTRVSLKRKSPVEQAWKFVFEIPVDKELALQKAKKGSIALNGVSLTVNEVLEDSFEVMVIPISLEHTNLSELAEGDMVNLETDQIAKYLARYLQAGQKSKKTGIDMEFLKNSGFTR